jgi:hypothetical protein
MCGIQILPPSKSYKTIITPRESYLQNTHKIYPNTSFVSLNTLNLF